MVYRKPAAGLATHEVTNQPPPLADINVYEIDLALRGAVEAGGGAPHHARLSEFGRRCGAAQTRQRAREANDNPPRLKSFDRYGHRLDEVEFHSAYHELMELGLNSGISGCAWASGEARPCPARGDDDPDDAGGCGCDLPDVHDLREHGRVASRARGCPNLGPAGHGASL